MSLATRCSSCQTVFRVVQAQLKVSEGWVRCGRCGTVFNALEALFDLSREKEKPSTKKAEPKPEPISKKPREGGPVQPQRESGPQKTEEVPTKGRRRATPANPEPRAVPLPKGQSEFADAQFAADAVADVTQPLVHPPLAPSSTRSPLNPSKKVIVAGKPLPTDASNPTDQSLATLQFVKQADRKAHWKSPRMQASLAGASLVLSLIFGLQAMHHFRDITAARWPQMAPLLVRWCQTLGCQIQAPRHIESVAVESITLSRNTNSTNTFLLSVALQNNSAYAVAMPALDLTLRDANGLLISRRMLTPQELQVKNTAIEPYSEALVQATITETDQTIVGFTVETFYP